VRFLGHIEPAQVPAALAQADIFVRPSRSEGMGNSFIEAMAARLPVIATQEGGITDFLFDEKRNPDKPPTGWAVDKNSPEQIANAVKEIMTNPKKVDAVRANALALVRERYDWDTIARQMETLLLSV
jgi:glycosyltransferase involved in cell wall biosynthesis